MFDKLISIIAPHTCLVCGKEGSLLCAWCAPDAILPLPERCYRCNVISRDSAVCKKCRRNSPLQYVWVSGQYADTAKELVRRLKFVRAKAAVTVIAERMVESIPDLPPATIITYIPAATSRVRVRGYDQSRLLAKEIAKRRKLMHTTLLVRHGQTRQVGADRKHRIKQAAKNYSVRPSSLLPGSTVLIIDDILTTGATLESAAKLLKNAGAKHVYAAVFAKK